MKKIVNIIIFVIFISLYSNAQDTLSIGHDGYLFMDRPNLCFINNNSNGLHYACSRRQFVLNRIKVTDSTKIYGIAATLEEYHTPSFDNRNVTAILFRACDTGVVYLDSTSQISAQHYFVYPHSLRSTNGVISQLDSTIYYTVPIYEFYFDSGINVNDTFYVGISSEIRAIFVRAVVSEEWDTNAYLRVWDTTYDFQWMMNSRSGLRAFHYGSTAPWGGIFPIIKPLQDTTDSTGVRQVVAASSVRVEPNPAHGSVSVWAAEGLRRVEFFDMTGLRVLSREATGIETHIDIAALPAGIYVVRVYTTTGTVSRKFVVM